MRRYLKTSLRSVTFDEEGVRAVHRSGRETRVTWKGIPSAKLRRSYGLWKFDPSGLHADRIESLSIDSSHFTYATQVHGAAIDVDRLLQEVDLLV
ncbi:MAG: hypothetical protein GY811_15600 [Myxococcales bacterium]|nr:hypothetical protein [Myxococcales bacterium]